MSPDDPQPLTLAAVQAERRALLILLKLDWHAANKDGNGAAAQAYGRIIDRLTARIESGRIIPRNP